MGERLAPIGLVVGASSGLAHAYLSPARQAAFSRLILVSRSLRYPDIPNTLADHHACDVTDSGVLAQLVEAAIVRASDLDVPLHVLYCCGAWESGPFGSVPPEALRRLWDVCLTAPATIAHVLLAHCEDFRFVTAFGMGGAANRIAYNAPYVIGADAARALIEAVGDECVRDAQARRACFGLALGLIDKGQGWLAANADPAKIVHSEKRLVGPETGTLPGGSLVGAVVRGVVQISYKTARPRGEGMHLLKSLEAGSSFTLNADIHGEFRLSPDGLLLVQSQGEGTPRPILAAAPFPDAFAGYEDEALLDQLDALDFDDTAHLQEAGNAILREAAKRRFLVRDLLSRARKDDFLRSKCETLPDMFKLVIFESRTGVRLRLHILRPEYEDVPHSHRWSMASLVVSGTVTNKYYGKEEVAQQRYNGVLPTPVVSHRMSKGSFYAFDDAVVHWFHGAPGAVTLTLRGPLRKHRSKEFAQGDVRFKYGADQRLEPDFTMTDEDFEQAVATLKLLNLA